MIDGKYVKLGYYDTQSDNLTWRNVERWIGGKVPQDRTIIRNVLRTVSLPLFISMATLSALGIVIAIGLIVFNVYNRHRRYTIPYHTICILHRAAFVNTLSNIYHGPGYNLQSIIGAAHRCLLFRVIYSSHPTANTIMLLGIIGCFLAVLCIGIDGRFVTPGQFLIVCQARAWTMSIGFTLAFGAMFSKVWRVHRLSTKAKADQGKVSRKLATDN